MMKKIVMILAAVVAFSFNAGYADYCGSDGDCSYPDYCGGCSCDPGYYCAGICQATYYHCCDYGTNECDNGAFCGGGYDCHCSDCQPEQTTTTTTTISSGCSSDLDCQAGYVCWQGSCQGFCVSGDCYGTDCRTLCPEKSSAYSCWKNWPGSGRDQNRPCFCQQVSDCPGATTTTIPSTTTTVPATTTTTTPPDRCLAYSGCDDCTRQSGCGYCADNNECRSGTPGGPSQGACNSWKWSSYECVPTTTTSTTSTTTTIPVPPYVSVYEIIPEPLTPDASEEFTVKCYSSHVHVDCIGIEIDDTECSWNSWDGNYATWKCRASSGGSKNARCYVVKTGQCEIGTPSQVARTIDIRAPDRCLAYSGCSDCTGQSGCGYCAATGECKSGTSGGPSQGSCSDWKWYPSGCTPATTTTSTTSTSTTTTIPQTTTTTGQCTPDAHEACSGGHIYWYDSCWNKGEKKQDCGGYGCTETTEGPVCNAPTCTGDDGRTYRDGGDCGGYACEPSGCNAGCNSDTDYWCECIKTCQNGLCSYNRWEQKQKSCGFGCAGNECAQQDQCNAHNGNCGTCTSQSSCGYCADDDKCRTGGFSGPASGSCNGWKWTQDLCPSPISVSATHSPQNPDDRQPVTFTAEASGNYIERVKIYVDSSLKRSCTSASCSYAGGPYSAGAHSYYATAENAAGNTARSDRGFTVSETPRQIRVSASHSPQNPTDHDSVRITATSDSAYLSEIRIYVDSEERKYCASFPCVYDGIFARGAHNYYATAKDTFGNEARSDGSFTVAPSACSAYGYPACNDISGCEWCQPCSGRKSSSYQSGACVSAGACIYSCAKDKCGADCGSNNDCRAYLRGNTCNWNGRCGDVCACGYDSQYCPEAGTVADGVCYWGAGRVERCSAEGCGILSCALDPGEECYADEGCLPACVPGDRKCNGNVLKVCDSDRKWVSTNCESDSKVCNEQSKLCTAPREGCSEWACEGSESVHRNERCEETARVRCTQCDAGTGRCSLACKDLPPRFVDSYTTYRGSIEEASGFANVDKALIAAIISQESGWNQGSCGGSGCGLMQIIPGTANTECAHLGGYEGVRTDARKNILCGTNVISHRLTGMSAYNAHGQINLIKLALASYNGGPIAKKGIDKAGTSNWDQISVEHLRQACVDLGYGALCSNKPEIMKSYVSAVMGYYPKWQVCLAQTSSQRAAIRSEFQQYRSDSSVIVMQVDSILKQDLAPEERTRWQRAKDLFVSASNTINNHLSYLDTAASEAEVLERTREARRSISDLAEQVV